MPVGANISGVVINEVLIDPSGVTSYDTNGDGVITDSNDDFLELYNTSGTAVDIGGWQVWDDDFLYHTFAGGTMLAPGGFITVISGPGGGGTPNVTGDHVFSSTGTLSFTTSSSWVQLFNPGTGEYVRLNVNNDLTVPSVPSGATTLNGSESASDSDGLSVARNPDGDTNWVTQTPNPGQPNCFAAGTLIATPSGQSPVEQLRQGDLVQIVGGAAAPVKWIGRQTVSTRFGPAERLMPVRFAAGSLAEGLPHTDLTVTADHAMLVDGVLCHAGALVNGTSITRVPLAEMGERFTVYHIETDEHEILLANGAPAETFIDNVSRRSFDNFAEFDALYGDVPEMRELDYPRAMSARQVPARIREILGTRAVA